MSANITFNPVVTTNAAGGFSVSSEGYIQGTALNDPAIRNQLAGGVLDANETLPMWGGVGVSESIPAPGSARNSLGGNLKRALLLTGASALTGFSVFDQDHSMITSPQSPVPLAGSGMGVNFYRLGSGARIAVKCDPTLASLAGGIIVPQVSWDFAGQQLTEYDPAHGALAISAATWAAGVISITLAAHTIPVGTFVNISGIDPAGYNGDWEVLTAPDNTHLTLAGPAVDPGAYVGGGQVDAGGGALNVKVLDIQVGNSMTVNYDPVTGFATWNRNGSTAIILI